MISSTANFIAIAKSLEQPAENRIGSPFIIIPKYVAGGPSYHKYSTLAAFEKALEGMDLTGIEKPCLNGYGQVVVNFDEI